MLLPSVRKEINSLINNYNDSVREKIDTDRAGDALLQLSGMTTLRGLFGNLEEASAILDMDRRVRSFDRGFFRAFLEERIASVRARDNLFLIIFGEGESLHALANRRIMFMEPFLSVISKMNNPHVEEVSLDKGDIDSLLNAICHFEEIEDIFIADIRLYKKFIRDFSSLYRESARVDIVGYGEISTVMRLRKTDWCTETGQSMENESRWIWKKMPPFPSREELDRYAVLYHEYRKILNDEIGIRVPAQMVRQFSHKDYYIVYAGQEKADEGDICNKLIKRFDRENSLMLYGKVMEKLHDVFLFNRDNGRITIGIDAQLSNWVLDRRGGGDAVDINDGLIYIDTSSPMIRIMGVEQINPEIFIKSAASFLRPVIRKFFLQEVLDRYYDIRLVTIDIIANLHKEKREDLIDCFIEMANNFFSETGITDKMLSRKEIDSYYSSDAFIWKFYQASRKIDRFITEKILRKKYTFRIPGKIKR